MIVALTRALHDSVSSLPALLLVVGVFWVCLEKPPALVTRLWLPVFTFVVASAASAMVAHAFLRCWAFRGDSPEFGLLHLVDGTGHRPFVHRRLAFEVVRVATEIVEHFSPTLVAWCSNESPLRRYAIEGEVWSPHKAVAFHVAFHVLTVAYFCTVLSGACLLRSVRFCSWVEAVAVASLSLCLVPLTFVSGAYLYDATEGLLETLLLIAILKERFFAVPLLFALLAINKESALLLVPALFPLFASARGARTAVLWTASLAAIAVSWLIYLRFAYGALPGTSACNWLSVNAGFWTRWQSYVKFDSLYAPTISSPRGGNVLSIVFVLVPCRLGWRHVPPPLRRATVLIFATLVPVCATSMWRDEIRNLSLSWPFLLIVALEGVRHMRARDRYRARHDPSRPRLS